MRAATPVVRLNPTDPIDTRRTHAFFETLLDGCGATVELSRQVRYSRPRFAHACFEPGQAYQAAIWSHLQGSTHSTRVALDPRTSPTEAVALQLPASASIALACSPAPPTLVAPVVPSGHMVALWVFRGAQAGPMLSQAADALWSLLGGRHIEAFPVPGVQQLGPPSHGFDLVVVTGSAWDPDDLVAALAPRGRAAVLPDRHDASR
jgi:hypothetical protein